MNPDEMDEQLSRARAFLRANPDAVMVMHPETWAELVKAVAPDIPNTSPVRVLSFQGVPVSTSVLVPQGELWLSRPDHPAPFSLIP